MTTRLDVTELGAMPYVLMYHSVDEYREDPFNVTVRPATFVRHLKWFRRRGLRGVSVGELLAARARGEGRGLIGLSFDDGYTDFATEVVPALQRFGFTATVFVIAGRLGGTNAWEDHGPVRSLLTAEQVGQVADAGMEIGSHGLHHVSLCAADDDRLTDEVVGSRAALSDLTGRDVAGFCYPYGHLSGREVAAVRAAGYAYGCGIWPSEATGRHAIARTYIGERDGALRLFAKQVRHEIRWRTRIR